MAYPWIYKSYSLTENLNVIKELDKMAVFENIRVMISSRSNTEILYKGKSTKLSEIRKKLQMDLQNEKLLGERLFDVWISEDAPAPDSSNDVWDKSLKEVKRAHILIVICTGEAGWAKSENEIGICHAELEAAMNTCRDKVYFIRLPNKESTDGLEAKRNKKFMDYVEKFSPWMLDAKNGEDVIEGTKHILRQAVAELAIRGVLRTKKGKFDYGDALDWSRLDFEKRQDKMKTTLREGLLWCENNIEDEEGNLFIEVLGKHVLTICHAIPASMSVAAAREMVGQPFLHDHKFVHLLNDDKVGPVHLIACNRSATESQAIKQLGFPDATIVSTAFGVYVADNIQKIQMIFIANCRDDTTTLYGVQEVFKWLEKSGEDKMLVNRAIARKQVIDAIARNL